MRFTPTFLDEIKARLPVSEVVRGRVKLAKSGREWKGLSPISQEKTPSFFVNDQKMAWFDFSSGKNGNIFDFVIETEGVSFPEAVERLAGQAGLALPTVNAESVEQERRRATLHETLEHATVFFENMLHQAQGSRARGYLADRGLTPALQREFRIGYAPNERFALRDHLAAKGASAETMIEAGLLVHGEDINVPYDRFRDRVMFPIADRSGKPIAFGGRALDKDAPAKYLNSPETTLFHKGAILYNHHRARKAAHDAGTVIAVEGYVDVIAMFSAGFAYAVAPLGTALTPDQCGLLWKMGDEPILCFDGDKAGRKAAFRAIETALPLIGAGKSLRFAMLPEGQDPDDLVRSGGPEAMSEIISAARPLVEILWLREVEAHSPLDTPERRAALSRAISENTRKINDEELRRFYRADMEERLMALGPAFGGRAAQGQRAYPQRGAIPAGGRRGQKWGEAAKTGYRSQPLAANGSLEPSQFSGRSGALPQREALILALTANHPGLLARFSEKLAGLDFANRDMSRLRDALLALAGEGAPDLPEIDALLGRDDLTGIWKRIAGSAAISSLWCVKRDAAESDVDVVFDQALTLHSKTRRLHRELKLAEIALGEDASEINLARLADIQTDLASLEGTEAAIEGFGDLSGVKKPPV